MGRSSHANSALFPRCCVSSSRRSATSSSPATVPSREVNSVYEEMESLFESVIVVDLLR